MLRVALACARRRTEAHDDERAVLVHGDVHQWNALEADGGFKRRDRIGGAPLHHPEIAERDLSPDRPVVELDRTQRLVDAPITARRAGELDVAVPAEANIAPPGWYMVFLTDDRGVPSVGRWTLLS